MINPCAIRLCIIPCTVAVLRVPVYLNIGQSQTMYKADIQLLSEVVEHVVGLIALIRHLVLPHIAVVDRQRPQQGLSRNQLTQQQVGSCFSSQSLHTVDIRSGIDCLTGNAPPVYQVTSNTVKASHACAVGLIAQPEGSLV